jgi:hypothetical protein
MMIRSALTYALLALALIAVPACSQEKTPAESKTVAAKPELPAELPSPHAGLIQPPSSKHPPATGKSPATVSVPESIAGKWASVVLQIENKKTATRAEQVIALHSEHAIPESTVRIKVGDFLPHFSMDEGVITSLSNETRNPAVHVTIFDGQEEIYTGWLFQRFPSVHPFQDERFGIRLAGSNAKHEG